MVVTVCIVGRAMIAGGGAPEIEICLKLAEFAQSVTGVDAYCYRSVIVVQVTTQYLMYRVFDI